MAFVNSSTGSGGVPTYRDARGAIGQMQALGIGPDEAKRREQQYGVNPGGTGYVSGQAPPAPPASSGPSGMVPSGGEGQGFTRPSGAPAPNASLATSNGAGWNVPAGVPAALPPGTGLGTGGGTTTRTSALSAPAGSPGAAPPPVGIAYASNANAGNSPNAGAAPGSGVNSQGYNVAGPAGSAALGQVPVLGELTSTATTDLSPTIQAQAAAMGLSGNLNQERYNYRPGEAPAQDVVSLDTQQADQTRGRQQTALDALTAAANGTVPSAAEIQLREAAARNNAANFGAARALGGRSAGGAARAATVANAEANNETNVAAAAGRAAEQANARQALISALGGVRGQDIDTAQSNANLRQQAYGNNLTSQTTANAQADEWRKALLAAQLQALGIGTNAAGQTVNAAAKNTEAINKSKGGILDMIGSAVGI